MTDTRYPTRALRFAGLPVILADDDGIETQHNFKLDNNALADLEEQYGSTAAWQKEMQSKPFKTIRDTLALGLGLESRTVGAGMIQTDMQKYVGAIGIAFSLANGVDPTQAMAAWEAIQSGQDARAAMLEAGLTEETEPENQTLTLGVVNDENDSAPNE